MSAPFYVSDPTGRRTLAEYRRTHPASMFEVARVGRRFFESEKRKKGRIIVMVETDDARIDIGLLLAQDKRFVRVCYCVNSRHNVFSIVKIDRRRIKVMEVRS